MVTEGQNDLPPRVGAWFSNGVGAPIQGGNGSGKDHLKTCPLFVTRATANSSKLCIL
jgi:hypothetical protein